MRWFWLLLSLFFTVANAAVYKCERANGTVYFSEVLCKAVDDVQTEITIEAQELTYKEIKKIEQSLAKQRKQVLRERSRRLKSQELERKQAARAQKKRLRSQVKCAKVRDKITAINQEFKTGYTIKRAEVLHRKLAEYKTQQQEYCKHE